MNKALYIVPSLIATLGLILHSPMHVEAATYPQLVTVASDGSQQNNSLNDSTHTISADGRYLAFISYATNLIPNDTNGSMPDIFVRDRQTGTTEIVNVSSDGTQANNESYGVSISGDGRYVLFQSYASNLVAGDTNNQGDIFLHDRQTGTTERVTVTSNGTQLSQGGSMGYNSISYDGRFILFTTFASNVVTGDTNARTDVFVRDRQTGTTERVSVASDGTQGNEESSGISISSNGRYVVFNSAASNLVAGDTNAVSDAFIHDRQTGATERVSVATDGSQGNETSTPISVSNDGRYVSIQSYASNLVTGDTNNVYDTFVRDRQTSTTQRVSVASDGAQANGTSSSPYLSEDGRYVAFISFASNLVAGDTNASVDSFVHDRQTGTTQRVNVSSNGTQGNGGVYDTLISADGHYVSFISSDSNLVANDANNTNDVFITVNPFDPPAVTNSTPVVNSPTVSPNPVAVNTSTSVSASFTDADAADTHTATVNWGDGTGAQNATVTESNGSGTVAGNHTYTSAGVYTVTLTVTDNNGAVGTSTYQYITVYDATAGWTSGSKEYTSPAGAVAGNSAVTGKVSFGFQAKYQQGDIMPSGKNIEFDFGAANLSFTSSAYQWLVVNGTKATLKATGSLNGTAGYTMLVSAIDQGNGQQNGLVRFQIKAPNGSVVYDTQPGEADATDPTTAVTKGKITVH